MTHYENPAADGNSAVSRPLLLVVTLLLATAVACGGSDRQEADPTTTSAAQEAVVPPIPLGTPGTRDPSHLTPPDGNIEFVRGALEHVDLDLRAPSTLAFGPDGRLYIGQINGQITAVTLVDNVAVDVEVIVAEDVLQDVLGIAFNSADAAEPLTIYASHTALFAGEEGAPYAGTISRLVAPDFARVDVVTGLPVSTIEHGTNGIAFDAEGRLYIAQGGTTNSGVPSERHPRPEMPLSAAILIAEIADPGFDGAIVYAPPGEVSDTIELVSGDVRVYASGLRNPYDLVIHSNGRLYATDNGPNDPDGAASTSCASEGNDPWGPDELNLVIEGGYYGHPNRNRGRSDERQCSYRAPDDASGESIAPIALLAYSASADGMAEYISGAFGGRLRGNLIYAEWAKGRVWRVVLADDGGSVIAISQLVPDELERPLDVAIAPDGTVFVAEMDGDRITYFAPVE